MFPQTPARVQLSIWPGGLSTNGEGTIEWAGGVIDWNSEDIKNNGYYYASFESVDIECYNATSSLGTNTGVSYTYSSLVGTNNTVVDGDKPTILKSLLGTGTNMSAAYPSAASSGAAAASATAAQIPGLTGTGGGGVDDHSSGDDSSSGSSSSSGTSSASGSSSTGGSSGFSQGTGSSGSGSGSKSAADKVGANQERVLKGSVFAGIVAVVGMMAL
jgi:hypothetical protein